MVSADGYFWGSSPFFGLFFLFFLAHQSGGRARAKARGHQLFIAIVHVHTQLETTRL